MSGQTKEQVEFLVAQFQLPANIIDIIGWGNGLMSDTYRLCTDSDTDYLLQRINEAVYPDVDGLMNNIYLVTEKLNEKTFHLPDGREKQALRVIVCRDGKNYFRAKTGTCWRVYNFMMDAYSIETADDPEDVYKTGLILGQFHYLLRDFPVERLKVVVPDFHNPRIHYQNLLQAVAENPMRRFREVSEEVDFFQQMEPWFDHFNDLYKEGKIPLRVNHNDPKVNNIMFDKKTREPICMIDLDTMMPGFLPYDFGDAIRSTMCTGKDHGPNMNMDSVICDMELYNEYLKGFLEGCQGILTEQEREVLPMGAKLIALESAMRYLTDYLNGDVYFKTKYAKQNLVKCRMHIRLFQDMCEKI